MCKMQWVWLECRKGRKHSESSNRDGKRYVSNMRREENTLQTMLENTPDVNSTKLETLRR